jgi:ribosomal protein S18 acetylase RimI-like enzyme
MKGIYEIKVRRARIEDVDEITRIWWQLMSEHQERDERYWDLLPREEAVSRFREWIERCIGDPAHVVLVGEMAGKPAGFVHGAPLERPPVMREPVVGRIMEVAVDKESRGKGLGRNMVLAVLAQFRSLGLSCSDLFVDCGNKAAQSLYHSLGFYPREFHMVRTTGID